MSTRRTRAEWRQILSRLEESNLSVRALQPTSHLHQDYLLGGLWVLAADEAA